ncbi:NAD(P)H-dependent glycerol-3-phosphate dehydrogenase [Paenibacillus endoradicis]|uniref:NAD(P)H-dependent glycerol-3-phosphate dehydrogenase n=1 Tax=Paenibacillus endoradicis TaxID=2972487 RepID=UPI002158D009|nr:NAD(P)H-dependent glycerol-3-phosphate dehydrogenase [Paenibacillus endoradicis]MCR8660313.1 NAD(P)H-dependent glycerol-3-phosphate dehydrogenase [Paenibacillus endoradicis]
MSLIEAKRKATVVVAGSWGTALAFVLASNQYDVVVWTRTEQQAEEINVNHINNKYLPNITLPSNIRATTNMEEALAHSTIVLFVAPSSAMRSVAELAKPFLEAETIVVHATKGFEPEKLKRMSVVLSEALGRPLSEIAVISGPSHAEEVILKLPTTVVVAAENIHIAEKAQEALMNSDFRVYTNNDVIGIEVAGALKNIIALAAGIINGLDLGDNAKAALLTRGLAEISRLGTAMGANPLTFIGLAGVGDLVVTATSQHSRNFRAGYMLADGTPLSTVLEKMGMVVEGVKTTRAAHDLAKIYNIEMPITNQLYEVLFNDQPINKSIGVLMGRVRTNEMEPNQ